MSFNRKLLMIAKKRVIELNQNIDDLKNNRSIEEISNKKIHLKSHKIGGFNHQIETATSSLEYNIYIVDMLNFLGVK